ncbi:iron dicitrate transport regulator FecR [Caulobacter flavus]|uniref:Iron dicitrate transport regulator FecR n=1 Tax=Caulobacter flavus TaxID=1679497 RepID=A0A2N5CNZ4_9CAUL|nr:FecR family protein [Caulobacter flavus]AYV48611.1 iron dicitrate transport regulator FecR [Caulobacter flavus]PLR08673.1 iron dicitrate transport regulator FecR [Caulobacter flavus]
MTNSSEKIPRSTQEAADWFTRLSDPVIETEDLEAFSRWRAKPGNRAAYERIEDISQSMLALTDDPDMKVAVNKAMTRPREPRAAPVSWPRLRLLFIGGVTVAACLAAGVFYVRQPTYQTKVGETFSARLEDGSRIQLNTDSAVRVRYSAGVRRIELLRGQALFEVAHNAARPFIVAAADTQVRALGTRFEVRRQGDEVHVVLAQGSVEVTDRDAPNAHWRLAPGQAIQVATRAPAAAKPVAVDVATATSWTTGNLTLQDMTLADAVAELNRYSRDKILLSDGVPADHRVSGVFPAGENGDFIAAVSALYGLETVRLPNGDVRLQPKVTSAS